MSVQVDEKRCCHCNEVKPVTSFYKRSSNASGYKSWCKACSHEGRRAWHERNAAREVSRVTAWRNANPRRALAHELKRRYRMTVEEYDTLLAEQNGACAICREPFGEGSSPHVDHCHGGGDVRGLLCSPCNKGIGHFRDKPERLIAAAAYLERVCR